MKKPDTTIMFCHYGDSPYLLHVLKTVRLTNPKSRIILLGDEKNKHVAKEAKIEHYFFSEYSSSEEIVLFDKVYKHVAGKEHGREFWTNFVFKRWFHIHDFIKKNGISKFWHFDSDNLILTNLAKHESKFAAYDCTEQCNGICMNGLINSFEVVDGYIKKINELFQNEKYLNNQLEEFQIHTDWAFTEMRAYETFKKEMKIKSIELNTIINNETFDHCICLHDGFETYDRPVNSYNIKKLFINKSNTIFCYHTEKKTYIKMNSLNLSWVPYHFFESIFIIAKTAKKKAQENDTNKIKELDIFTPITTKTFWDRVRSFLKNQL